jgi:hypothetical protein
MECLRGDASELQIEQPPAYSTAFPRGEAEEVEVGLPRGQTQPRDTARSCDVAGSGRVGHERWFEVECKDDPVGRRTAAWPRPVIG